MSTQGSAGNPETLFRILMDDGAEGLTLIHAAPIRTAEDFQRVRAELAGRAHIESGAALSGRRR
jgi:hypothetical protein